MNSFRTSYSKLFFCFFFLSVFFGTKAQADTSHIAKISFNKTLRGTYAFTKNGLSVKLTLKKNGRYKIRLKGNLSQEVPIPPNNGSWKNNNQLLTFIEDDTRTLIPAIAIMSHPPIPESARTWSMYFEDGKLFYRPGNNKAPSVFERK